MTGKIDWYKDKGEALEAARESKKPVLLDFFNPE